MPDTHIPAPEALELLKKGNQRFVAETRKTTGSDQTRRTQLTVGQEPFAIILGCSDSRVPAELVFDVGLGDLFVIRVAGNIVAPSQVGSVEFAVDRFKTRLVVVLGHSNCGAVCATLDELKQPAEQRSPNMAAIVDRIRPSIEVLLDTDVRNSPDDLLHHAVVANILASANQLRHGSQIIEKLVQEDGLMIVGAHYSLDTGEVEFFDGL
jgi:carbonic anhydrase